jgi:UTP:GlnB (protein PII) uridylyltransferase
MTDFLDSMPAAYARAFSGSEAREHAAIVVRRGAQLVHAEICAGLRGPRVCVVADDRPGLLALMTDSFLVHGLRVKSAQVYCRRRSDGQSGVLGVFELQQPQAAAETFGISLAELGAFLQTLSELVAEDVLVSARASKPAPADRPVTRVYFDLDGLCRGEFILLVEAPDSEGLLNAISTALHGQSVRILASEIRTEENTAHDRFDLASTDGEPLSAIRLCDIQQAVYAALPKSARR